jgi:tight adherence protein B
MPGESDFLVLSVVFIAVLALVEGIYYTTAAFGSGSRRTNRRLQMLDKSADPESVLNSLRRQAPTSMGDFISRIKGAKGPVKYLDGLITGSGLLVSTGRVLLVMCVLSLVGIAGLSTMAGVGTAFAGGIAGGFGLPIAFLWLKRRARIKKFGAQLPDAIDIIVRSMRAGHPVPVALGMVAQEMSDPIGTEIGMAVDEMTYGLDLREAMENMRHRVGHPDLNFLVAAVNVQAAIGGNLADVLAGLSAVIRQRFRMFMKIKALSAEGKFSAIILSIVPFMLYGIFQIVRPEYFNAVKGDDLFPVMMGGGFGLAVAGIIVMAKMVNLRV